jgi:hypothetical protein
MLKRKGRRLGFVLFTKPIRMAGENERKRECGIVLRSILKSCRQKIGGPEIVMAEVCFSGWRNGYIEIIQTGRQV